MVSPEQAGGQRIGPARGVLARRTRRFTRRGFAWVHRKGFDAGAHRGANARWWKLLVEANRLAYVYSFSSSGVARSFERSLARFAGGLVKTQATAARPVALGIDPLFRIKGTQDKRHALDLARDARRLGEHEFAELLLRELLVADPGSPLGWSYLADVYKAQGLLESELEARGRFLALTGADTSYVNRVDNAQEQLISLLNIRAKADHSAPIDAEELYAEYVQAAEQGDARGRPLGILNTQLVDIEERAKALRLAGSVLRDVAVFGTETPQDDLALAQAYAAATADHNERITDADTALNIDVMDVSGFREYVTDKRVCLIANSEAVSRSGLGGVIDAYDVVVRFNSFKIDAPNTGSKTSVHALIHMHDFNWEVPVDVRMVFSGDSLAWRRSVVNHLRGGAQRYLADETLRWPVKSENLVADASHLDIPTSGFNLLRLLDFLDVSKAIDLIGFDFNESGPFRLDEAMSLPIAGAHNYSAEKTWVLANATAVDGAVISLR